MHRMNSFGGLLRKKLQATNVHEVSKVCVNWLSCAVGGAIRVARDDVFSTKNKRYLEPQNPQITG